MMKRVTNQLGLSKLIIILIFGIIAAIIFGVVFIVIGSGDAPPPKSVTLTMWGVWDETSDIQPLLNAYSSVHPYVTIKYTKKRLEEYEDALLKAWATGTGPDIYALPSTSINKYTVDGLVAPMPASTRVAYYSTKKVLFTTETVIEFKTDQSLSANDVRRNYVDVVYDDMVSDGVVYGLPFGIDTLVMYYNRDLLNQAQLVQPPATWNDFATTVSRLTVLDGQDGIVRSAAALGTESNIVAAVDIVTLLMLQNGAVMATGDKITFANASAADLTYRPGQEAVRFFNDFANPQKAVYTWNDELPNAIDQFTDGKLAFLIGYHFHEAEIKAKNRGVDYGVGAIPQVDQNNSTNYANYWVQTVAKNSPHTNEAWNFIQFASNPKRLKTYLVNTNQTSPLRSILNEQLAMPESAIFAQQALTAKSWFHGNNPETYTDSFTDMINEVLIDPQGITQSIVTAAQKIQQGY